VSQNARRRLSWGSPLSQITLIAVAAFYGLALARLGLLNAFLLVLFSLVGVAALIEPLAGLLTALFLGLLWAWLRSEVPAVPALIALPVLALTIGAWLMRGAARWDIRLATPPLFFALAAFVAAASLSLWDAVELTVYGLPELAKWLTVLVLFWLVIDTVDDRRVPWLVGGLLSIGVFQSIVGLWQFGLRGSGPEHFAIVKERLYRAYGTFEQPNPYAGFLGLTFALGVGILADWALRYLRDRELTLKPWVTVLLTIATLLMGAALAASWSRGAWLGMGVGALVIVAALPRRAWLGVTLVALVLLGTLTLYSLGLLPAPVAGRLTDFTQYARFEDVRGVGINDANYAVIERLAHWQVALEMWRANFWTGVGFGDYEPAYPDFQLINWPNPLGHAHNYYLNVAAETGVVGLAAYILLWGMVFWRTWRLTRGQFRIGWWRGLAIGLLGAWTHLSVHHLFDNLYVNNVHLVIGAMVGLVAVLGMERGCTTANERMPSFCVKSPAINSRLRSRPCAGRTRQPTHRFQDQSR
jgi:putative inorganic carbon (HCO3(-)) transporter